MKDFKFFLEECFDKPLFYQLKQENETHYYLTISHPLSGERMEMLLRQIWRAFGITTHDILIEPTATLGVFQFDFTWSIANNG